MESTVELGRVHVYVVCWEGENGREKRNLQSPCPAFIFIKLQWLIELARSMLTHPASHCGFVRATMWSERRELDSGEAFAAHVTAEGRPEAAN
jgi:hypothetical protein